MEEKETPKGKYAVYNKEVIPNSWFVVNSNMHSIEGILVQNLIKLDNDRRRRRQAFDKIIKINYKPHTWSIR